MILEQPTSCDIRGSSLQNCHWDDNTQFLMRPTHSINSILEIFKPSKRTVQIFLYFQAAAIKYVVIQI